MILTLVCMGYHAVSCCSSTGPEGTEPIKEDPSFAQDLQPIFSGNCALGGCHNAAASAGLNLTAGQAYSNLVNVASTQSPDDTRVIPFSASESYLIVKLEGRQSIGARMPLGSSALSANQIQNIKNWIERGARDN